MRNRPAALVAGALLAGLLSAPAADAAPVKKACQLIVDRSGDSSYDIAAHDIVSGDVATGPRKLVAGLRVRSLADDPKETVRGTVYRFNFDIDKKRYTFELRRTVGRTDEARLIQDGAQVGSPEARLDVPTNTVIFTVDRTVFPGLRKRAARVTDLSADSYGGNVVVISSDTGFPAKAGTAYVDRTPSCLAAA